MTKFATKYVHLNHVKPCHQQRFGSITHKTGSKDKYLLKLMTASSVVYLMTKSNLNLQFYNY